MDNDCLPIVIGCEIRVGLGSLARVGTRKRRRGGMDTRKQALDQLWVW